MNVEDNAAAAVPEIVTVEPITTAVVRDTVSMDRLTEFYDRSFGLVREVIEEQGLTPTTAGFGHYFGIPAATVELEVGFGTDRSVEPAGDVRLASLPGGRCARAVHVGAYSGLGESWRRLADWIGEQGDEPAGSMWEEYVTMPTPDADPSDMRTVLTWPLVEKAP